MILLNSPKLPLPENGFNTTNLITSLGIPKNSKNPDIAHEYINFMCSRDAGVANATYTYYASPLTNVINDPEYLEAMAEIHEDAWETLYGESASTVKTQAYLNLDDDSLILLNNLWEELKGKNNLGPGIYIGCGIILCTLAVTLTVSTVRKRKRAKYYQEPEK